MDSLDIFSVSWLRVLVTSLALTWLAYRAYQVLLKPADELINLLGLEVPSAPDVSLACIKSNAVVLHWKAPDKGSVSKYTIRINGIDVGETGPQDTAVSLENLRPDHYYIVRVVTSNNTSFHAPSPPLRFKTLRASTEQTVDAGSDEITTSLQGDEDTHPAPVVRPYKALLDAIAPPPTPPPTLPREHNAQQPRTRRSETGRRISHVQPPLEHHHSTGSDGPETGESLAALTEKLEALRREMDETEKQIVDEDEEYESGKAEFEHQRDEKKRLQKAHDDASKELRRQMAQLTQENYAALKKKETQEKLLDQKQSERIKLKKDIDQWIEEAAALTADLDRIREDKALQLTASEQALYEKDLELQEHEKTLKETEAKLRAVGTQLQLLEEEKKRNETGEEESKSYEASTWAEADRLWAERTIDIRQQYSAAWAEYQEGHALCIEAQRSLLVLQQQASATGLFNSMAPMEFTPTRRNSIGILRRRTGSIHEQQSPQQYPTSTGFVMNSVAPYTSAISSTSPPFSSPFFNINNGMAITSTSSSIGFSAADMEVLTGGAPMSPTAGGLLPSGLLGDELDRASLLDELERQSSNAISELTLPPAPLLPGLGAPQTLEQQQQQSFQPAPDPSSPISVKSPSPSLFTSPREGSNQLATYASPEPVAKVIESDGRSIRSISSSLRGVGPTSFGSRFFGGLINRQRGKTMSEEGPALGSLKGSQSQSMPRQDPASPGPIGTHPRRGSDSGNWIDSMSNAFTITRGPFARSAEQSSPSQENPKHIATRRRPFKMFGASKPDPWNSSNTADRPSSPRPASIQSFESNNLLPRPSTENQQRFGWPANEAGNRSSLIATDWPGITSSPWSRHPSRRPSLQHGQAGVFGSHDFLPLDSTEDLQPTMKSPTQAPIGTRPQSSHSRIPPTPPTQLNPAAPNFTSLFTRGKKGEKEDKEDGERSGVDKKAEKAQKAAERKAEKAEKAAERKAEKAEKAERKTLEKLARSKEKERDKHQIAESDLSLSPTTSRISRDNYSFVSESTTPHLESIHIPSPRDSLEQSQSERHSFSHSTNSAAPTSAISINSTGKESFMQKLTRKGSSSKFNFPSFTSKSKKGPTSASNMDGSELGFDEDSDASFLGTPRISEPGGVSPQVGSDTPGSTTSGTRSSTLGWTSSLRRIGKRDKEQTPSLHESITSEATTADEEEAEDFLPSKLSSDKLGLGVTGT